MRSATPAPRAPLRPELPNLLVKAKSVSQLSRAAMLSAPSRTRSQFESDASFLNTLPDPRTPSPASPRPSSADPRHPDLSNEVALLSTKLVNAINHQTNLDDTLQQTRHELDAARRRLATLEDEAQTHARMLSAGLLLKKSDMDASLTKIRAELAESRKQRDIAEKGRKEMEVELENLTSALFEEANTMVAAARKESEGTERKNAQLRSQLNDTELLLASQQEQLADLKNVMERMSEEQEEPETLPRSSTAPSTPGLDTANKMSSMLDSIPMSPNAPGFGEIPPDHPLRFSHLITPVLRNDVQAYIDFAELLKTSRAAASSHSRTSSGVAAPNGHTSISSAPSASSSSPSIPGSFSSNVTSSPRDGAYASSLPPLKDHKFYKRCLAEDIEPTLRLDLAPALSWLARRTVIGAVTSGTLVIEPFIPPSRFYGNVFACSLCGESRRTEPHARRHRFRTSEDDSAQRYPLCEYCLGRMRTTCDFLGFLRMVRDGLWRARTDEDIGTAWEESVRLREKMFWARLGGGVVPTAAAREESPIMPNRRSKGLSRMNSYASSTTTKRSRDEPRMSSEYPSGTLEVPKLHDPIEVAHNRIYNQTSDEAGESGGHGDLDHHQILRTSGVQNFATSNEMASDRPSTPVVGLEKHSQEVESLSVPPALMTTPQSTSTPDDEQRQSSAAEHPNEGYNLNQSNNSIEANTPKEGSSSDEGNDSINGRNSDQGHGTSENPTSAVSDFAVSDSAVPDSAASDSAVPDSAVPGSFD